MGINQRDSVIDVSEKPMRHLKCPVQFLCGGLWAGFEALAA